MTVADMMGLEPRPTPSKYDPSDFEAAAGCQMACQQTPGIAALNARNEDNPVSLPAVADRLPAEPLVVLPYEMIGQYGGTVDGILTATRRAACAAGGI